MSLLEIFITYLAIGSAFAMRAHFLNRRRPILTRIWAVLGQFLFWLPNVFFRLISGKVKARRVDRSAFIGNDPEFDSRIEGLLSYSTSRHQRNQVREVLERYAALHTALEDGDSRISGQFELFAIAGNGNGSTGTPCLRRKNLSKLKNHKLRTTEDLIELVLKGIGPSSAEAVVAELAGIFDSFGDETAIEKLESLNIGERIGDPSSFRMAA